MQVTNVTNDGRNLVMKVTSTVAQFKEVLESVKGQCTVSYNDKDGKNPNDEMDYMVSGPLPLLESYAREAGANDSTTISEFKKGIREIL